MASARPHHGHVPLTMDARNGLAAAAFLAMALSGVVAVHDLHVWTIASGRISLSGHVVAAEGVHHPALLQQVCDLLQRRYGIDHATIQVEDGAFSEPGAVCSGA